MSRKKRSSGELKAAVTSSMLSGYAVSALLFTSNCCLHDKIRVPLGLLTSNNKSLPSSVLQTGAVPPPDLMTL